MSQPISTSNECALRSRVATMVNVTASAVTSRLGLNPECTFVTIGLQSSRNRFGRGRARAIVLLSQMPRSMNYTKMPTFVLKGGRVWAASKAAAPRIRQARVSSLVSERSVVCGRRAIRSAYAIMAF